MAENKVNFGLSNVYYAKATYSGGSVTYGTPKHIAGGVSLSLTADSNANDFFADNIRYYRSSASQGYSGTIEFAKLTEEFCTDILGVTTDTNGVVVETSSDATSPFALIFQVEGDQDEELRLLYYCEVTRPPMNANTITDSTEPDTVTLDITVSPRPDTGEIKASTGTTTATTVASAWTNAVYTG